MNQSEMSQNEMSQNEMSHNEMSENEKQQRQSPSQPSVNDVADDSPAAPGTDQVAREATGPISDDEWREQLSEDAYRVLRQKGTGRPFSGALLDESRNGIYVCAGCKQPLFTADTKFDAGCGWPSFYASLPETVNYQQDSSHGMQRVEIVCANCGGHLGHVFPDGPAPTGQRYCVNSVAMEFKPE